MIVLVFFILKLFVGLNKAIPGVHINPHPVAVPCSICPCLCPHLLRLFLSGLSVFVASIRQILISRTDKVLYLVSTVHLSQYLVFLSVLSADFVQSVQVLVVDPHPERASVRQILG